MDARGPTHSHFSHHHPLELTISSNGAATSIVNANCAGCTFQIVGGRDYYSCRPCSFFLHSACFKMPSSLLHPADPDHHLTLTLLNHHSPAATSKCRACALPLGAGFSYHCHNCHVHYHSLCLFRPISKTDPSSHNHTLSLRFSSPYGPGQGFRCDVCGNPGLPEQWLYCCDPCGFDSHVTCPAVPAPTTTSRAPLTSPGNTPAPVPAPEGYPPVGYGVATTAITNVQQQQQMMGSAAAVLVGQTQQQVGGTVVYHPITGQQPPPPAVVGGGYPVNYGYNNMQQQQMMMGGGGQMGMGGLIMTSAVAGGAQGVAGKLVETAFDGFGGDGSSSSNHIF